MRPKTRKTRGRFPQQVLDRHGDGLQTDVEAGEGQREEQFRILFCDHINSAAEDDQHRDCLTYRGGSLGCQVLDFGSGIQARKIGHQLFETETHFGDREIHRDGAQRSQAGEDRERQERPIQQGGGDARESGHREIAAESSFQRLPQHLLHAVHPGGKPGTQNAQEHQEIGSRNDLARGRKLALAARLQKAFTSRLF